MIKIFCFISILFFLLFYFGDFSYAAIEKGGKKSEIDKLKAQEYNDRSRNFKDSYIINLNDFNDYDKNIKLLRKKFSVVSGIKNMNSIYSKVGLEMFFVVKFIMVDGNNMSAVFRKNDFEIQGFLNNKGIYFFLKDATVKKIDYAIMNLEIPAKIKDMQEILDKANISSEIIKALPQNLFNFSGDLKSKPDELPKLLSSLNVLRFIVTDALRFHRIFYAVQSMFLYPNREEVILDYADVITKWINLSLAAKEYPDNISKIIAVSYENFE